MTPAHPNYAPTEWITRREFMRMVGQACAKLGVTVTWSAEDWIATLTKNNQRSFIYGYTFPLNDAGVAGVLRDKTATYRILAIAGVPAVPHFLLRVNAEQSVAVAANAAQKRAPLPLVVKPNMGKSGGFDVMRCQSPTELDAAVRELASRHQNIAVSPFIKITREFRVIMLRGEPLLTFSKTPATHEWRHNLRLNATPKIEDAPEVIALAGRAMQATGAQLAAVDIAETPDGYKIIEINGGISLSSFAKHSPEYATIASDVYTQLITAVFTTY